MSANRLAWLAVLALAAPAPAQTFDEKLRTVLPSEAEDRWVALGWHTNLAEARQEAQRQGKPLLLWVMNGNPLGCA